MLIKLRILGFKLWFSHTASQNHATGYASIFWCLSQDRTKWEGCGRRASSVKIGDDGGGPLISPDGVAPSQMVGVSASVIFPCTTKSRRFLLALAHPGSPRKRAIKRLCMCDTASESWHKGSNGLPPSAMDEVKVRPGHWLASVLCISFSALRLLVFSNNQETGWEECVQNNLFYVEWDVKPQLKGLGARKSIQQIQHNTQYSHRTRGIARNFCSKSPKHSMHFHHGLSMIQQQHNNRFTALCLGLPRWASTTQHSWEYSVNVRLVK